MIKNKYKIEEDVLDAIRLDLHIDNSMSAWAASNIYPTLPSRGSLSNIIEEDALETFKKYKNDFEGLIEPIHESACFEKPTNIFNANPDRTWSTRLSSFTLVTQVHPRHVPNGALGLFSVSISFQFLQMKRDKRRKLKAFVFRMVNNGHQFLINGDCCIRVWLGERNPRNWDELPDSDMCTIRGIWVIMPANEPDPFPFFGSGNYKFQFERLP